MRPSSATSWTRLSLFLCAFGPLSSVTASSAPSDESIHASIPSRPDSGGEIANNADLPLDSPPHHHVSLNIHPPGVTIHQHAHRHVEEQPETQEQEEPVEPVLLVPRTTSSFPQPFDTSLGTNFTSKSCPDFFNEFLNDSSFTNCYAISMLLRNSNAFFHTLSSAPTTSHILDLACAADVDNCATVMSDFATSLLKNENCGQDYANGNPLVTDAYTDFNIYQPIYRATCLQNPDTSDYCFVDAVTNTSNPTNYDVYFIPYGSGITGAPFPTCNSCLQASLDIFSKWAQVDGQPLTSSYLPTAVAINGHCGAGFAKVNITVGADKKTSSAPDSNRSTSSYLASWITLFSIAVITHLGLF